MINFNKNRLIYAYINNRNLTMNAIDIRKIDNAILQLLHRDYARAYATYPDFVSFVLNVVVKCSMQLAQRSHDCINIS